MYIYIVRTYPSNIHSQFGFTKEVAVNFFKCNDDFLHNGKNTTIHLCHYNNPTEFIDLELQPATDYRFSSKLNNFLENNGDTLNVDDLVVFQKIAKSYCVRVVNKGTALYDSLSSLMNPNDRHLLLCEDASEEITTKPETKRDYPLQQISYGAPGTGKSHGIDEDTKYEYPEKTEREKYVIRTTFHPDSDYSTFVGAYKPSMEEGNKNRKSTIFDYDGLKDKLNDYKAIYNTNFTNACVLFGHDCYESILKMMKDGKSIDDLVNDVFGINSNYCTALRSGMCLYENKNGISTKSSSKIIYKFVPQAFIQAYTQAWRDLSKPTFLVIEEINRGNCAQIFGDIFQLLDRKENGSSSYDINPNEDIQLFLEKDFTENGIDEKAPECIKNGKKMSLPNNLYIWATMNTSDQSLFPIDSAFKRRWDWKYVPIDNESETGWYIMVNGKSYSWSLFLEKVNNEIAITTSSEDKQLGFYFCKANDKKEITAEKFVNKVLFYLYNDVFKDYDFEAAFFKHKDGDKKDKLISFREFFNVNGKNINENVVAELLDNLGVDNVYNSLFDDVLNHENEIKAKNEHKETLVSVTINGNKITADGNGRYQFDIFYDVIKQLDINKVGPIIESLSYHAKRSKIVTKTPVDSLSQSDGYSYIKCDDWYIVKGIPSYTYIVILEKLREQLGLDFTIEYK